jgi:hypothetical protein
MAPRQETAALRDFELAYVRFGSKADMTPSLGHVRSALESGHTLFVTACPLSADFVAKVVDGPEEQ